MGKFDEIVSVEIPSVRKNSRAEFISDALCYIRDNISVRP
jgi:hypothetical protein